VELRCHINNWVTPKNQTSRKKPKTTKMKKTTYIIGYFAALAVIIATVFKINHLSYTGTIVAIAWTLMSIYFYFYIIDKMGDSSGGKLLTLEFFLNLNIGH
jgi:hypothetical protein